MNHSESTESRAVEKYLLGEMSPVERDAFEEHFFDCAECAADLRATAAFLDTAKQELKSFPGSKRATEPAPAPVKRSRFVLQWPVFACAALAASLLVTVYQNIVVYPHLTREIAQLSAPEVLPSLSLVNGNSRGGGDAAAVTVSKAKPFLLLVDVPTQDRFMGYTCSLYSPSGSLAWHVQVSAQEAKDTVSIRVPGVEEASGTYTLTVRGDTDQASTGPAVELAHYRFTLNIQD